MRKGHGSTKVPGVKLRPQAPRASSSKSRPSWVNGDDERITEQDILQGSKKPFLGVVICASCLPDKPRLFKQATELGAQTSSNLTNVVTHLICLGPGSLKYSYCVSHGVPIMHPSWISEAHQKWLEGETVDPAASEHEHRLPVFATAILSITGVADLETRTKMERLTIANGGQFLKDLGSTKITHLVCGADHGDEVDERGWSRKMRHIEHYNSKHDEKVHLVWEEWYWDCLEFGGQLDEAAYDVSRARPKRKIRRENTPLLLPISSLADVTHNNSNATTPIDTQKMEFGEEVVTGRKVPGSSASMFEGLLKNRGFEVKSGKLVRSPSKGRATSSSSYPILPASQHKDLPNHPLARDQDKTALSAFKRSKSFAPSTGGLGALGGPSTSKTPLQRSSSARQVPLLSSRPLVASEDISAQSFCKAAPNGKPRNLPSGEKHLFVGYKFLALGDAKSEHIDNEIKTRGGTIVSDKFHADFILVRLSSGKRLRDQEPVDMLRSKFRTECWLEQCMFEEKICEPSEHISFLPLDVDTPLPGAENIVVHLSGYPMHSKTYSIRMLKLIGATIVEHLNRKATHLLTCSPTSVKYAKALEWGIPCVDVEWLHDCVKYGKVQNTDSYLLKAEGSRKDTLDEVAGPIKDITNDEFIQGTSKSPSRKSSQPSAEPETSRSLSSSELMNLSWKPSSLLSSIVEGEGLDSSSSPIKSATATLSRTATEPLSTTAEPSSLFPVSKSLRDDGKNAVDDDQLKIPSSNTPSPIKLPVKSSSFSSPTKQSTTALKSAITSLLGKRDSSEDQDSDLNSSTSITRKSNKRAKPLPRTKPKPLSSSKPHSSSGSDLPEGQPTTIDYPLLVGNNVQPPVFNHSDETEDSLRVTYEDPCQMDEKRRLMRLLTIGTSTEDVPVEEAEGRAATTKRGRNLVRRSTRN